jgi:hypothetical protein
VLLVELLVEALVLAVFVLPQPQSTAVIAMAAHERMAPERRRLSGRALDFPGRISAISPRS